ncbi:ATP-binding protein [Streptomyces phyllanthi]|uniref:ATP-binding protein n=1 Tax=Streptomyces phyllanthi TaxID=1803180 RepID=UPI002AD43325|nr:ATP-binding protein [Streptomyces phyllanthi]
MTVTQEEDHLLWRPAELAGGHADRTWDKRMRELIRPHLLVLDDFAMRQLAPSQADDLYEFVSERQGPSLIIISNRAPSDRHPLFPNPVVTESLPDRPSNPGRQVIMNTAPATGPTRGPDTRRHTDHRKTAGRNRAGRSQNNLDQREIPRLKSWSTKGC